MASEEDRIDAAFADTPRRHFLRTRDRRRASYDGPIEIGHGGTCSQPRTVEAMLRLLDVRSGQSVLDVGAGSGWTTALLAHLVGPGGSVLGVEIEPALVTFGAANLIRTHRPWARLTASTYGVLGAPDSAPYDRILVSAEAHRLPSELIGQLATDGVMVCPVQGRMVRVELPGPEVTEHGYYRFVPLR